MANFCIASIQGGMLLGKVRRDAGVVENVAHQALAHLQHRRRVSLRAILQMREHELNRSQKREDAPTLYHAASPG
jgi:hypothetical protein